MCNEETLNKLHGDSRRSNSRKNIAHGEKNVFMNCNMWIKFPKKLFILLPM